MGMIVYKVKWHLGAVIKTAFFKLTFGRDFSVGGVRPSAAGLMCI